MAYIYISLKSLYLIVDLLLVKRGYVTLKHLISLVSIALLMSNISTERKYQLHDHSTSEVPMSFLWKLTGQIYDLTLGQLSVREFSQNTFEIFVFFTIFQCLVITSLALTSAVLTFIILLFTNADTCWLVLVFWPIRALILIFWLILILTILGCPVITSLVPSSAILTFNSLQAINANTY